MSDDETVTNCNVLKPERSRTFLQIVVSYPAFCTYPEYEGKPYYAIKYLEDGETIVGFGTYKPDVLSEYIRKYFISPTEPERKKGEWIKVGHWGRSYKCNQCGNFLDFDGVNAGRGDANFCPNCGADMRDEKMSDLIDRNALMKEFRNFVRRSNHNFVPDPTWNDAVSLVGSMPSLNTDIILCQDCKWWDQLEEGHPYGYCRACRSGTHTERWDISIRRQCRMDFYCADAEAKEEEDE